MIRTSPFARSIAKPRWTRSPFTWRGQPHAAGGDFDNETRYVELLADFEADFVDLPNQNPTPDCLHPDTSIGYPAGQELADEIRKSGHHGLVYPSVRHANDVCLAALWSGLIQNLQQGESWTLKWPGSSPLTITKAANAARASFRAMRLPASSASAHHIAAENLRGQTNLPSAPFWMDAASAPCPSRITVDSRGKLQLLHRGIEYSVLKVEPGIWKWTFRIGGDVTTGKTATNIDLLAARRVQLRINRALTERDRLGL
jgi:hypothetical protein